MSTDAFSETNLLRFISPQDDPPQGGDPPQGADPAIPAGGEGGAPAGGTPAGDPALAKTMADLLAQNAKLAQQNEQLLARQTHEPERAQPFVPGNGQVPPAQGLENLKKYFDKKIIESPGEAVVELLALAQQMNSQTAQSATHTLAVQLANGTLRDFMRDRKTEDPELYARAESTFNEIVNKAITERGVDLGKLPPTVLQNALQDTWEQAIGRVSLNTYTQHRRANPPPPYATGQGGSTGNFSTARGGDPESLEPRDAIEKEMIDTMRSYVASGVMKEEDLKATLKAHRAGDL